MTEKKHTAQIAIESMNNLLLATFTNAMTKYCSTDGADAVEYEFAHFCLHLALEEVEARELNIDYNI